MTVPSKFQYKSKVCEGSPNGTRKTMEGRICETDQFYHQHDKDAHHTIPHNIYTNKQASTSAQLIHTCTLLGSMNGLALVLSFFCCRKCTG